jgi:ferredoxin--NADP+ reductase
VTVAVAVAGAGPAGFAVAAALLKNTDATVAIIDRGEQPDALLRHGPASGTQRLRDVAREVDGVLGDGRVTYYGNVDVGGTVPLADLQSAAHAVVLATGHPADLPLDLAGSDSVGVGTVSHVDAWLAGSADVGVAELDLDMDSAVVIGVSDETVRIARVLCGSVPDGVTLEVADRLASSRIRHVQVVDPRLRSEISVPAGLPANLAVHPGHEPIGIVGRNRARALRCVRRPDRDGRVLVTDLRAQLLLRPRADARQWPDLDYEDGRMAHENCRVTVKGVPQTGLYVAGWAARSPSAKGSHTDDAAAVLDAFLADSESFVEPRCTLAEILVDRTGTPRAGWSAVAATEVLLDRFAGEGTLPLTDYETLYEQVDED